MLPSHAALDLLRRVHLLDPDRPASFHARGHARGHDGYPKYLAGAHEMRGYSLALTKLMAAPADLLFAYSCMLPDAVHALVDREANCEDVAAGFLASGTSGKPPLLAWPRDVAVRCAPLAPGEDPGHAEGKKAYFDAGYLEGGYFFRGADGPATRLGCRAEAAVHDFGSRGGGLSSKPGHFAARARCLAELEGVFGDALVTARETVGEFRGLPPVGGGGMEDLAEARELVRGPG
ncbi:hypothetical protein DFJ74DRAFT_714806 [Hyaloraphidium curvatum]|nr:hypothetical protein DFJ74DRAFT_714806 [Hyaloraphidium curvatum]